MKMRVYEIKETFVFWGKALLCMPVIAIFYSGFSSLAFSLNSLIDGKGSMGFGSLLFGLVILAVYSFLCFRFEWILLYIGSLAISNIMIWNDSSLGIVPKIILAAVSVLAVILLTKYVRSPKAPRKSSLKSAGKKLPAESIRRYRETLAKLPSNPRLFQHYCATQPKGEVQRMARDLPTLFFRYVPCREALEYIYQQNPDNAMIMVDIFIKFDENGRLISK